MTRIHEVDEDTTRGGDTLAANGWQAPHERGSESRKGDVRGDGILLQVLNLTLLSFAIPSKVQRVPSEPAKASQKGVLEDSL